MNAQLKNLVKQIRYTEGKLDCAKGLKPQRFTAYYLQGYSEQYIEEQRLDALTQDAF